MTDFIAKAEIDINVPESRVWEALTTPKMIKKYMFDTTVVSDWNEGGRIIWRGEWKGKMYEDKGIILKIRPHSLFRCTHFSPISGLPDVPENYHTLTYELSKGKEGTHLSLTQDNNKNEDEQKHSQEMWNNMLGDLKKLLEK